MFSSLRSRLWLTYALLVIVVLSIVALALVIFFIRNPLEYRQEVQRLRLISTILIQRGELLGMPPPDRLQPLVERADQAFGVRVVIFGPQSQVLADSRSSQPALQQPGQASLLRPAALPIIKDARGARWFYSEQAFGQGELLVVATPRHPLRLLAVFGSEFIAPLVQIAAVALLLGLLLAFWIARWVSSPLQRMAQVARSNSVAGSSATYQEVPISGPREVQTLGGAFNEMISRVQASQRSQRDFLANVSHELKTPLTSIQGFAQAILDGTADTPAARAQAAQVISAEAGRLHRLVLDLLDLARLDSGIASFDRVPVDLAQVLHGLVEKFAPLARQSQVDLGVEIEELPVIYGDPDRLAQVFTNLVENALKHSPAGGRVSINARSADGQVEVSVADSGEGIPPEEQSRIFERFYQVDKSRQGGSKRGVGLGLAIAREIVQSHGGTITVHNKELTDVSGRGSVFVVKLPLVRAGGLYPAGQARGRKSN